MGPPCWCVEGRLAARFSRAPSSRGPIVPQPLDGRVPIRGNRWELLRMSLVNPSDSHIVSNYEQLDAPHEEHAHMTLDLTPDQLLSTTRTVRKRLDLSRPVERDLLEQCFDLALPAPTGANQQGWHFV